MLDLPSIHIPLIALFLSQRFDIFGGGFRRHCTLFLNDLKKSDIDIFRHSGSVSAYEEVGSLLEPGIHFFRIL